MYNALHVCMNDVHCTYVLHCNLFRHTYTHISIKHMSADLVSSSTAKEIACDPHKKKQLFIYIGFA